MARNLGPEDRERLDEVVLSRPERVDPETGLRPPSWWRGEEDAAATGAAFLQTMRR